MRRFGSSFNKMVVCVDSFNIMHRVVNFSKNKDVVKNFFDYVDGVLNKISRFDDLVMFFDGGRSGRNEIYPEYKANRNSDFYKFNPVYENFDQIISDVFDCSIAMELKVVRTDGFEADDSIYEFVNSGDDKTTFMIVSTDKDFYSMVNDRVRVVDPVSSKIFDKYTIHDSFGVSPDKVIFYKAIVGDNSDNIKGVPRIRKNKVKDALNKISSIEEIFNENLGFSDSEFNNLKSNREIIERNITIISPIKLKSPIIFKGINDCKDTDLIKKLGVSKICVEAFSDDQMFSSFDSL